ncbi:MAG: hypothetical protein A3C84_03305 [Candidatus Ryanbacteria bacterium RIFCSPHIGHO2_02_FULL_48_12]|uniref:Uncharacterized protein n=1 Tax=Candidatus Ryanbacteria bacterium RIFCSPHIGHO2_01_FULL_48_27 TaxID=1802115 RepID=A0A1G2G7E8_9BACT|nr:MAG: hypothetical protein A2756_02735 [Candidatus Ryanbacteria bacterium RIFCSPHIGHO2_01_FULL_48_27]OGZ49953.1 MAG: hypothetical protein A3C84_03305 [Candidatus Ryanbacteria bacterium RIFCSPHIGHO2_02_FULL_48_12]
MVDQKRHRPKFDLRDPLGSIEYILETHYFDDNTSVFFSLDGRLMTPSIVTEMEQRLALVQKNTGHQTSLSDISKLQREADRLEKTLRRYDLDMHRPNNIDKAVTLLEVASEKLASPKKEKLDGIWYLVIRLMEEHPLLRGQDRIGYPHVVVAALHAALQIAKEQLEDILMQ